MERCLTRDEWTATERPARAEAAWWFEELRAPVYRYLICSGLNPADAEEVTQDTFLRLQRHLNGSGSQANLRGWIFEVARNAARDRRKTARWRRTVALDAEAGFADPQASPEVQAIQEERMRLMRAAMEKLSEQQRECILLRMSGLRYREIAEVMGISVSSAGELAARASARLSEECS